MEKKTFELSLLDINKFIKANNVQEIKNPVLFDRNNPTPDGLLSNEIFGITVDSRSNVFGYIDLHKYFIQPIIYKIWCKIDKNIKGCVYGVFKYKIVNGSLVRDDSGETGIDFLRKNIKNIKFKSSNSSIRRDINAKFLEDNRDNFFINKLLVIPPFYRDVKTDSNKVSVGDINRLYINILQSVRSLSDSDMYGFNLDANVIGRIQDLLLEVYNWFGSGTDSNPNGGIPSKKGILKSANMAKTADYASRLVITSPELNKESPEEIDVDLDTCLLPLASAAANFFPFVIFELSRFFENSLIGQTHISDSKGKLYKISNWQTQFNEERYKEEIDRFIKGYDDRFRPVNLTVTDAKTGKDKDISITIKQLLSLYGEEKPPFGDRPITWCELIYMATVAATKDKTVLITRYPIDTFYNQFPSKIKVGSTIKTIPLTVLGVHYDNYPLIRPEDIGTNTASLFRDSLNICNAYLSSIGGDYDGDTVTVKGVFTEEANEELKKQMESKLHYVNLGCKPVMSNSNEAIQSLFSLTLTLDGQFLIDPKF